ncbi:MAG: hypothetical protein ACREO7_01480 [Pseudoxanthomonas sp.]
MPPRFSVCLPSAKAPRAALEASSLTEKASSPTLKASPSTQKALPLTCKALPATFKASSPTKKASTPTLFPSPGNGKSVMRDAFTRGVDVKNVSDDAFFVNAGAFHIESNVEAPLRRRFFPRR